LGLDWNMVYSVRPMKEQDIPQVSCIERESFPPPWPATNFKKELRCNTLSHYFVACEDEIKGNNTPAKAGISESSNKLVTDKIKTFLRRLFEQETPEVAQGQRILGFAGLWFMTDEAHLANIAVCQDYRRKGVGELLLIAVVSLAIEQKASFFTLEVRASNKEAQALYRKYGLVDVGTRRGYYMDNKEDAVIMTADAITSLSYLEKLKKLKQAHAERWGISSWL
jgi:ribosomal-protein-alanine N-acetyltransferase